MMPPARATVITLGMRVVQSGLGTEAVGRFLRFLAATLLIVCFAAGLAVRLVEWFRELGADQRRGNRRDWAGRTAAHEVPVDRRARGRNRHSHRGET